jgi:hypothetical protein
MSDLTQLLSEHEEMLARHEELHLEFEATTVLLFEKGPRPVSDILDYYESAHSLIEEMLSGLRERDELAHEMRTLLPEKEPFRSQLMDFLERGDEMLSGCQGLRDTLLDFMNEELPHIVKSVYENTRNEIEEAATAIQKLQALIKGQALLQRFIAFPEHTENPLLRKALLACDDYESTLERALANETAERDEEEYRNAVAGISYTATEKQVRYLINLGANPRDLDGITKQQASAMINRMKKG